MAKDEVFVKCPECEDVKFTFSYSLLENAKYLAFECAMCGSSVSCTLEKDGVKVYVSPPSWK